MKIQLDDSMLINKGGDQCVYHHPHNPSKIIKIAKYPDNDTFYNILRPILYNIMPYKSKYWVKDVYKSYRQYMSILAVNGRCPNYIAGHHGFVQTSIGVGCVYEKICDVGGGGDVSLTIIDIINNTNYNKNELVNILNQFFNKILYDRVIINDSYLGNLCVVRTATGNYERIVLVDGIGGHTLIPLSSFEFVYSHWHRKVRAEVFKELDHQIISSRNTL